MALVFGFWNTNAWDNSNWNANLQKIGRDQIRQKSITPRRVDDSVWAYIQNELIPNAPFSGIFCDKTSDQSISANTATDITWDELIPENADISHSAGSATFTLNSTKKYDIDCVISAESGSHADWQVHLLYLVYDGAIVAQAEVGLYNSGSIVISNPAVINFTLSAVAGKTCKLQWYSANVGATLRGQISSRSRCTLRITPRGV